MYAILSVAKLTERNASKFTPIMKSEGATPYNSNITDMSDKIAQKLDKNIMSVLY